TLREHLRALPGVESVGSGLTVPLDGIDLNSRWGSEEARSDPSKFRQDDSNIVAPGFFETLHVRVAAGRVFNDADNVAEPRLAVVDTLLAAKAFPNRSAIGQRIFARLNTEQPEDFEIIG